MSVSWCNDEAIMRPKMPPMENYNYNCSAAFASGALNRVRMQMQPFVNRPLHRMLIHSSVLSRDFPLLCAAV